MICFVVIQNDPLNRRLIRSFFRLRICAEGDDVSWYHVGFKLRFSNCSRLFILILQAFIHLIGYTFCLAS